MIACCRAASSARRRVLERHGQEMARVPLRLIRKRVAAMMAFHSLSDRTRTSVSAEAAWRPRPRSDVRAPWSNVALKHDVSALKQRLHTAHVERRQQRAQVRHCDLVVRPQVHGSEQAIYVVMWPQPHSRSNYGISLRRCSSVRRGRGPTQKVAEYGSLLVSVPWVGRARLDEKSRNTRKHAGTFACTPSHVVDRPRVIVSLPIAAESAAVADWLLSDNFEPVPTHGTGSRRRDASALRAPHRRRLASPAADAESRPQPAHAHNSDWQRGNGVAGRRVRRPDDVPQPPSRPCHVHLLCGDGNPGQPAGPAIGSQGGQLDSTPWPTACHRTSSTSAPKACDWRCRATGARCCRRTSPSACRSSASR